MWIVCFVTVTGLFTHQHFAQSQLQEELSKHNDTLDTHESIIRRLEEQVKDLEQQLKLDRDHYAR